MGRGTTQITTMTGLDGLLGGHAKSHVVRCIATKQEARLSEIVGSNEMSKSAITNAVKKLEESGVLRTLRREREVMVRAAEPELLAVLLSFDERAHHVAPKPVLPIPGTPLDDAERDNFAAFLMSCAAPTVPDYAWHDDELTTGIAPGWAGRDPVE
jgi:DNA-binding transcriptional ArsR family regulator